MAYVDTTGEGWNHADGRKLAAYYREENKRRELERRTERREKSARNLAWINDSVTDSE